VVRADVMVVVVLAVGGFGSWKIRGLPPWGTLQQHFRRVVEVEVACPRISDAFALKETI